MTARTWHAIGATFALLIPAVSSAQQLQLRALDTAAVVADTTPWPSKFHLGTNEFNLGFMTLIVGGGWLQDYASFNQDSASAAEFHLVRQGRIRDSRFLLSGVVRSTRPTTWQSGLMYDWSQKKWLVRQTMLSFDVPELWGQVHIGRMKEGLSFNKITNGYDGFTMERFTFSDVIPLFGDGVRWNGYLPKANFLWNLGGYVNWLSEGQTWQSYQSQLVGRAVYLKLDSDTAGTLLHIGAGFHAGKPQNDSLRLKSKPEVFEATNFIDTGVFPATFGTIAGLEAYYRNGSFIVGSEYYGEWVKSAQNDNPFFHGGVVHAAWLITGEVRPYTTRGGVFRAITPRHPVTKGGKGALETALMVSYSDYDADTLSGGKFWRVTPAVNWYLDDHLRLAFEYGFGSLNRFGTVSRTEFFQARMQFQFAKIPDGGD